MESNQIIKFNNKLGILVKDNEGNFRFLPAGFGRYYYSDLQIVTESDIEETNHDEKVEYLRVEFVWGKSKLIHSVGDIVIFEYKDSKGETLFHPYLNYKDMHHSYDTLDQALVGAVGYKYDGPNSQAAKFFYRMVKM